MSANHERSREAVDEQLICYHDVAITSVLFDRGVSVRPTLVEAISGTLRPQHRLLRISGFFILCIGRRLIAAEDYGQKLPGVGRCFYDGRFCLVQLRSRADQGGFALMVGLGTFVGRPSRSIRFRRGGDLGLGGCGREADDVGGRYCENCHVGVIVPMTARSVPLA